MSYGFSPPFLAGISVTRNGYLRAMSFYSMLMASVAGISAFLVWQMQESVPWPLILGMVFLAVVFGSAARKKDPDNAKENDTANTFWGVFALAGIAGGLMGQVGYGLDSILSGFGGISFRFGPLLMVSVLWAAFLVAAVSFGGLFLPRLIFEEPWGLSTALSSVMLLAILIEQVAFLILLYVHGGDVISYHMTWWSWLGVALFLSLMGLSWRVRTDDVSWHDNAILASGGPLLNLPELAEGLGQVIDRLNRAPWSDGDED